LGHRRRGGHGGSDNGRWGRGRLLWPGPARATRRGGSGLGGCGQPGTTTLGATSSHGSSQRLACMATDGAASSDATSDSFPRRCAASAYRSVGRRKVLLTFLVFLYSHFLKLADRWAPVSMSAGRLVFLQVILTGGLALSVSVLIWNQLNFSEHCNKPP
jgi:hypothetical protein